MRGLLPSVSTLPAVVPPAVPRWRDAALVGGLAAVALLEGALRPASPGLLVSTVSTVLLTTALLWRRAHPLVVFLVAAGVSAAVSVVVPAGEQLVTSGFVLLFLYAVLRWGSARAIVVAGLVVAAGLVGSFLSDPLTDALGGVTVAALAVVLGVLFRSRAAAARRELERRLERGRGLERERLARELHDTVAHHVSAIAIQAQAGLAVAATRPDAATDALRVIEGEASRTLAEMRAIVGVLRGDGDAPLAPPEPLGPRAATEMPTESSAPALTDLLRLDSRVAGGGPDLQGPRVEVRGLDALGARDGLGALGAAARSAARSTVAPPPVAPEVATAVFRIAQEAVTNARRHAVRATLVVVELTVAERELGLSVTDDGELGPSPATPGFGITGMIERATLLGGSCTVERGAERGHVVTAVVPRAGVVR